MCICDLISANVLGCKIHDDFGIQSCLALNQQTNAADDKMFMAM